MKLLLIVFCIAAAAQAGNVNRHHPRQADYESLNELAARLYRNGNLPSNENSQINYQNSPLPLGQVDFSSKSLDVQQNYVQSTPKPDFGSNQYFVSSTVAPDTFANQQFISSTPNSIGENVQEFQSQGPVTNFGQARLSVLNSNQPYFVSSTVAPDTFANQQFISSTPNSIEENVQEFQSQGPVTNFGQARLSVLNSNQPNFVSSTVAPDAFVNQQFISSTPDSIGQNVQEFQSQGPVTNFGQTRLSFQPSLNTNDFSSSQFSFGSQNPVTVHAITRGGSLDESFGTSEDIQYDENEETEVSKNFYFFAAPEEPEAIQPRINFAEPTKKNVNIVFIKAPAAPKLNPIQITPPEVKQEKTVVYVLVKKPELNQQIFVKAAPISKPKKPEVFFVKYNNEAEAQEVVDKVKGEQVSGEGQIDFRAGSEEEQIYVGGGAGGESAEHILSNSESSSIGGINNLGVQINEIPHGFTNQIVHIGGNQLTSGGVPESLSLSTEAPFLSGFNYRSSTVSPQYLVSSTPYASGGQYYVSTTVSPNVGGQGSSNSQITLSEGAQKYLSPN